MKVITKKAAVAVLGLAVIGGFSTSEASAGFLNLGNHPHNNGLIGSILGNTGDAVNNALNQIGQAVDHKLDVIGGAIDHASEHHHGNNPGDGQGGGSNPVGNILDDLGNIIDDTTDGLGDVVQDITHQDDPYLQLNLGVVTNILAGAGIDLAPLGIDLGALTAAEADALLNLQLLGIDLEALLDADALAGLGIFTDDGLNIEALLCAIVDGSLTVDVLDNQVAAIDLFVALGIDLQAILDENGLGIDLDLACGCTGAGPDSPLDPNNPNNPTDPNNPGPSNPVPEPATAMLGLMGAGTMLLAMSRRRKA